MPKNKTHSGMKKRVKVTGSGKPAARRVGQAPQPGGQADAVAPVASHGDKEIAKVDGPRVRRLLGL